MIDGNFMSTLDHPKTDAFKYLTDDLRKYHRTNALRELSREFLRILISRAEDPMMGHVAGYAARAVAQAEALLVELEKVERGAELTEEMNIVQGTLFQTFRIPGPPGPK